VKKTIIANVKNAPCDWDANLNQQFDPDGAHKRSFGFQMSHVSRPFIQGWGNLEVHFITLQPGKTNYPYHYHTANEEMFYIISGQGTLRTPEGEKTVSEGDVIIMPAHESGAHQLTNTSDIPLVYLDVKTTNSPDVILLPDSEKFLVLSEAIMMKWFKLDSNVNYLSGE